MKNISGYVQLKDENISLGNPPFAGGVVAWQNLFTYQVPARAKVLMTHFGNYMATADWGLVAWRVCVNGIPTYPLERILDQMGLSTLPRLTQPIRLNGGDVLTVDAEQLVGSVANEIGIAIRFEVE